MGRCGSDLCLRRSCRMIIPVAASSINPRSVLPDLTTFSLTKALVARISLTTVPFRPDKLLWGCRAVCLACPRFAAGPPASTEDPPVELAAVEGFDARAIAALLHGPDNAARKTKIRTLFISVPSSRVLTEPHAFLLHAFLLFELPTPRCGAKTSRSHKMLASGMPLP